MILNFKSILPCAGLVLLTGCAGENSAAKVIEQLKGDPAIVHGHVTSVYGQLDFTRIGGTTNSVSVGPDGTITVNK